MKRSELKKTIKEIVRECLNEIVMESFIEETVKSKVISEGYHVKVAKEIPQHFDQEPVEPVEQKRKIAKVQQVTQRFSNNKFLQDVLADTAVHYGDEPVVSGPGQVVVANEVPPDAIDSILEGRNYAHIFKKDGKKNEE